jgi:hypothetical protein
MPGVQEAAAHAAFAVSVDPTGIHEPVPAAAIYRQQQVGDLEQHPASQSSPHRSFSRNGSSTVRSSFRAAHAPDDQHYAAIRAEMHQLLRDRSLLVG